MRFHLHILHSDRYTAGYDAAEYAIGHQVEFALKEAGGDQAAALPLFQQSLRQALRRFTQAQSAIMSSDTREWLNGFTDCLRDALHSPERWLAA